MRSLAWTEYLELFWRGLLIALLVWFGMILRDIGLLRMQDRTDARVMAQEQRARQGEIVRLLRNICVSSTTIYDAARGVCDPGSTAEIARPPLPRVTPGLAPKR